MSARTPSGGATRVRAGRRPRLTFHGGVHKNITNILVSAIGCQWREDLPGGFVVHQDVEVSHKDLFDATVERIVRQHQGNHLCTVGYYVGVLDGITPTGT